MTTERPTKTKNLDPNKCNDLFAELIKVYQKYKPTAAEILITYGNLGYSLGASIGGYESKGPSTEELEKLYYSEPNRLDVALMIQGTMITQWLSSIEEKYE